MARRRGSVVTDILALCQWDGDSLVPAENIRRRMDGLMTVGETYLVEASEYRPRSINSHKHFFASLKDIHLTLPEGIAEQYPTVEHLRKKLLIQAGFYKVKDHVAQSPEMAAFAALCVEMSDEYCVSIADGCVVRVFTAKSQATDFMDNAEFQASKVAVLAAANDLLQPRSEETEG